MNYTDFAEFLLHTHACIYLHLYHYLELSIAATQSVLYDAYATPLYLVLVRLFCITASYGLYNRLQSLRMRFALQYSTIYVMSFLLSVFFYMHFCVPRMDNIFLVLVDYIFPSILLATYTVKIISILLGLHDWSVGIAMHIDFAYAISRWSKRLIYCSVSLRALLRIAKCIGANSHSIEIVTSTHIVIIYLVAAIFLRLYHQQIQTELNKYNYFEGIVIDNNVILATYISLTFFCVLNITELGIEGKLTQAVYTVILITAAISADAYCKKLIIYLWSWLDCIEYENNYTVALVLARALLISITLLLLKSIWKITDAFDLALYNRLANIITGMAFVFFVIECIIILFGLGIQRFISHGQEFNIGAKKQRVATLFYFFRLLCGVLRFIACVGVMLADLGVNLDKIVSYLSVFSAIIAISARDGCSNVMFGILLIIEDALNIGDLVEIDQTMGTVENIGLMFIRVRSIDGTLHFVQSGQIKNLRNKSRDFAFVMLNTAVDPSTSVEKLEACLHEVFVEIQPLIAKQNILLGSLEHRGIVDITRDRLLYQARIKCSPGQQFVVKRLMNNKILDAFKRNNIELAGGYSLFVQTSSISNSEYKMH